MSFSLAGAANVAASASGSSLTYAGILPGTDVTETATPDGISEALTLASAAAGTSWTFPLTLNGLTATLDGGSVDLTDSAGNLVGVIPPAVARSGPVDLSTPDSQASSTLTYQLVTQNGAPALQMSLDPAWLNAPGRVFPVIVDPTVTMDPQGSDYAQSNNGTAQTANNSGSVFLPSGTTTTSGTTYQDIAFLDYSSVHANYANAHLTSASLKLFDAYAAQCTAADTVTAYQVTGSWRPSTALTYPGPAYTTQDAQWTGTAPAPACANTTGLTGKGGWLTLPMNSAGLGLLNQWTAGSAANFGFAVLTSLSSSTQYMQFDSYNDGSVSTSQGGNCSGDCRPYLQLTYTTTASEIPPQVNSQYPPSNSNVPTLSPELIAYRVRPRQLAVRVLAVPSSRSTTPPPTPARWPPPATFLGRLDGARRRPVLGADLLLDGAGLRRRPVLAGIAAGLLHHRGAAAAGDLAAVAEPVRAPASTRRPATGPPRRPTRRCPPSARRWRSPATTTAATRGSPVRSAPAGHRSLT